MPVTRRQLLQQLGGDSAEKEREEPPAGQVSRTPVREQNPEDELEWVESAPDRCNPNVNADHQMIINITAQARTYFSTRFNPREHKQSTADFVLEGLHQISDGTLIDEASRVVLCQ